jgi:ADP-ribose pyrophosphatase YjhB (NUDIX family)
MDCSLSEGASRYLDVLYEEYDRFDVQQTTVGVNPEEFSALEDRPDGAAIRVQVEGEAGVLAVPDGNEWALPGGVLDTDPDPDAVAALVERRTGVRCSIDGLDRVSIVCLRCEVVDDEIWTLSALFSATAAGGAPRPGTAWREPPIDPTPTLSLA